jgi:hypothetical protein
LEYYLGFWRCPGYHPRRKITYMGRLAPGWYISLHEDNVYGKEQGTPLRVSLDLRACS